MVDRRDLEGFGEEICAVLDDKQHSFPTRW